MENNIDKFELKCVLPRFFNETNYDYEFSKKIISIFLFFKKKKKKKKKICIYIIIQSFIGTII